MNATTLNKDILYPFCADSLRQKKLNNEFQKKSKPLSTAQTAHKTAIENYCIENELQKLIIEAPGYTPNLTYVTRTLKTVSGRITRDAVEEGLEHFFDANPALPSDKEALTKALWDSINLARKSDKISMQILTKPFKDAASATRVDSGDLVNTVKEYWGVKKALGVVRTQKKEKSEQINQRIKQHCPAIINSFNSRHKKSQKINMQHNNTPCSFYVRLKRSSVSPSLKKNDMIQLIRDTVADNTSKEGIIQTLVQKFENLPKKITEKVTLDKGHYQPAKS